MRLAARLTLLTVAGVFYIKKRRPRVDYTKYLGKEWKPEYHDRATFVCNHSVWMVISQHLINFTLGCFIGNVVLEPWLYC